MTPVTMAVGLEMMGDARMERRPTILIADDHILVAAALTTALEEWFRVAGVVQTVEALGPALQTTGARAVVLDVGFPEGSSLTSLPDLVEMHPDVRFVVLTAHADRVLLNAALEAGAAAFVVKHSAPTELRVAIEEALAGRIYVTPLLHVPGPEEAMFQPEPRSSAVLPQLSSRQLHVLRMLRDGASYKEITDVIGISVKTVEYHLNAIRGRLGLAKVSEIVRWAEEHLPPSSGEAPGRHDPQDTPPPPIG